MPKTPKHARHAAPDPEETTALPPQDAQPAPEPAQQDAYGAVRPAAPAGRQAQPAWRAGATTAMPPAASGQDGPYFSGDGAYSSGAPVRPVDFSQQPIPQRPKRMKAGKVLGIVAGCVVGVLAVAYIGVALYFGSHFMPNSKIGDIDVSLMSASDVERVLSDEIEAYELAISGQGFDLELTAADAGLTFDASAVVGDALGQINNWLWPVELSRQHDGTEAMVTTYNDSGLDQAVRAAVESFNATATQPTNATVVYDAAEQGFVVQREAVGTALDADAVVQAADEALRSLDPTATLTAQALLQPTVLSTDERLTAAASQANTMITADLVLTMAGSTAAEVDADLISGWVVLGEDLSATLDEAALTAWVDALAADCNTVGTTRTYTRPDGKVITVSGGVYGWSVDYDSLLATVRDGVAQGQQGTVEIPCSTTGTAYNGVGERDWGNRYVDIDLSEQHVRMYDDSGALIWESDCISGIPDGTHDTSVGVYWLNAKQSPSKLISYENGEKIYESTVQYWMPFDGNAIGLHDADWQPGFGGTMYQDGYGSHGCVNLPPAKAAELYSLIQEGDVVVSHW